MEAKDAVETVSISTITFALVNYLRGAFECIGRFSLLFLVTGSFQEKVTLPGSHGRTRMPSNPAYRRNIYEVMD
jgi:hypothetical protein